MDGTELLSTQSEKDLGFTMDEKFDFGEHIKASLAKANRMIAWVSRNVICKDKVIMSTIYRCLVRPHLEYCVQCSINNFFFFFNKTILQFIFINQ